MAKCKFCHYSSHTVAAVHKHIIKQHKNHPKFSVNCEICGGTWRKYDSYRKHLYRKHRQMVDDDEDDNEDNEVEQPVEHDNQQVPLGSGDKTELNKLEEQLQLQAAYFALKMKSSHSLSQSAVNDLIEGFRKLLDSCHKLFKATLQQAAAVDSTGNGTISIEQVKYAAGPDPFAEVSTEWKQNVFFRKNFGLLEPVEVRMGARTIFNNKTNKSSSVSAKGYVVPFLNNLRRLLSMPEVQTVVFDDANNSPDSNEYMKDFQDGLYCKKKILLMGNNLRILGYYDDIEVVNPIGVHTKKHKLSVFFWSLLNIPPKLRSKLSCIQVVAIAKTRDCKQFGLNVLLHDFIRGLTVLSNEGITVHTESGDKLVKGGLVVFAGDTLASNFIGGFKEGVGFAYKLCRSCEVTRDSISKLSFHSECTLRNEKMHRERCDELKMALTPECRVYWSRTYGVNAKSILLDVPEFELTRCLIHDVMHLLFEGVTMMELKQLLKHLILDKKYFTLAYLNAAVKEIAGQLSTNSWPNVITVENIQDSSDKLKQTAHQMMILACVLPLAVGNSIPLDDEKWINYIRLVMIHQLCTSPVVNLSTATTLEILIARRNMYFSQLYSSKSFTPKLHYLVHLPEQLRQFGPLRNQWCMRMEAKNSLFKRKKLKNTKNVPKTVAVAHQLWMCSSQLDDSGCQSHSYLSTPVKTIAGKKINMANYIYADMLPSLQQCPDVDLNVFEVAQVISNDITYHEGDILVGSFSPEAVFYRICSVVVIQELEVIFVSDMCELVEFDHHLNAFHIQTVQTKLAVTPDQLLIPWPAIKHQMEDENNYLVVPFGMPDVYTLV